MNTKTIATPATDANPLFSTVYTMMKNQQQPLFRVTSDTPPKVTVTSSEYTGSPSP